MLPAADALHAAAGELLPAAAARIGFLAHSRGGRHSAAETRRRRLLLLLRPPGRRAPAAPRTGTLRQPRRLYQGDVRQQARDEEQRLRQELLEDRDAGAASPSSVPWEEYFRGKELKSIKWDTLMQCHGSDRIAERPQELLDVLMARLRGTPQVLDDSWCAACLKAIRDKIRSGGDGTVPAARALTAFTKELTAEKQHFVLGTQSYNVIMRALYDDNFPPDVIFQFYGTYKPQGVKPNATTFGLVFSACLKARKKNGAEGFYEACRKVIEEDKVSYRSKMDILQNCALGLADMRQIEYAKRFIELLQRLYKEAGCPPDLPNGFHERKKHHLYIDPRVARLMMWATSDAGSKSVVEPMEQWFNTIKDHPDAGPCFGFYLKLCGRAGDVERGFKVWNEIYARRIPPDTIKYYQCQALIDAVSRLKSAKEWTPKAMTMLNQMSELGVLDRAGSEQVYAALIKVHVASGDYRTALETFEEMRGKGMVTSDRVLRIFCVGQHSKNHFDIIQNVFNQTRELSKQVKDFAFTTQGINKYFSVLADLGMASDMEQLIDELVVQHEFKKDLETYHRVLEACAKDKSAHSYGTFYRFRDAGQEDFPSFFSHMKHRGTTAANCEAAQKIFDKLVSEGLKPTRKTYNCLMAVYATAGQKDQVFRLNEEMTNAGLGADFYTYYHMVNACAEGGDVPKVDNLINQVIDKQMPFNQTLCSLVIKSLSNTGEQIRTLAYTRTLLGEDMAYDHEEGTAKFINAHRPGSNEVETGFRMVEALQKCGYKADLQVLGSLMGLCVRAGHWERAEEVYEQIKKAGLLIRDRSDLITHVLKMYHSKGDVQGAVDLLRETVQGGVRLSNTAYLNCLSVCAHGGNVELAMEVVEILRRDPDNKVSDMAVALVLLACAKAPRAGTDAGDPVTQARDLLHQYRAYANEDPDSFPAVDTQHVYHTLLYVAVSDGQDQAVDEFLEEMREKEIPIDRISIAYFPRSLVPTANTDRLAHTWELMDKYGLKSEAPDTAIMYHMMKVCYEARNPRVAIKVLAEGKRRASEAADGANLMRAVYALFPKILNDTELDKSEKDSLRAEFESATGHDYDRLTGVLEQMENKLQSSTVSQQKQTEILREAMSS